MEKDTVVSASVLKRSKGYGFVHFMYAVTYFASGSFLEKGNNGGT